MLDDFRAPSKKVCRLISVLGSGVFSTIKKVNGDHVCIFLTLTDLLLGSFMLGELKAVKICRIVRRLGIRKAVHSVPSR